MTISPTAALIRSSEVIKQGAEAKVYKCYLHPSPSFPSSSNGSDNSHGQTPEPILIKYRFEKHYRHPTLNASLTKSRVAGEARALLKCQRSGVSVPGIRMVDASEGVLGIEWIEGKSVRVLLGGGDEDDIVEESNEPEETEDEDIDSPESTNTEDQLQEFGVTQSELMELIGAEIAKMHLVDVIHGDLTTSNMMLRRKTSSDSASQLVLIDFGLSYVSSLVEDKAVDLYVLERAFASTHPNSEPLFASVLKAYEVRSGKEWKAIGHKLDEVRLRGRKRSMVG